jgi:hypothetical protein
LGTDGKGGSGVALEIVEFEEVVVVDSDRVEEICVVSIVHVDGF